MQALPPEQGSQAPHMMLRHSLGGGGQARWSDTGKPLRAAPKLKPPALPGDTYLSEVATGRMRINLTLAHYLPLGDVDTFTPSVSAHMEGCHEEVFGAESRIACGHYDWSRRGYGATRTGKTVCFCYY